MAIEAHMTPKFLIHSKVTFADGSTDSGTIIEIDIDSVGRYYLVRRTYTPYKVLTLRYSEDELTNE